MKIVVYMSCRCQLLLQVSPQLRLQLSTFLVPDMPFQQPVGLASLLCKH